MNSAPWFPLPVRLTDDVMPWLRDTELRVLLVVLRQTWGWRADMFAGKGGHKRRDWFSHRQLCRRTGRGSDAVSAAVASLVMAGLIIVEDAGGAPLPTPEARRRYLGRLYFRPGEMWGNQGMGQGVEMWKTDGARHPGKPGTTTH